MADVIRWLRLTVGCGCLALAVAHTASAQPSTPLAELDTSIAAAEESLRSDEHQIAESRYRTALQQGWMILGRIHASDRRWADARRAFERASTATVDNRSALQSLAMVQLQTGETDGALGLLTQMASASPRDIEVRLALAEALVAAGRKDEAAQELDEIRNVGPQDAESTFALATGYLRIGKTDRADALFAAVAAEHPQAETFVLIGRIYRDLKYYSHARTALRRALAIDPRLPRAHYYLATSALMEEGVVRLDEAIAEFRQELKVAPNDVSTIVRLGMALVEARRNEEALPLLEKAVKTRPDAPEPWTYLGRCQLALNRAPAAVVSLRRALDLASSQASGGTDSDTERLRMIHYQLGTALRATGATREAEQAFAEAERLSAKRTAGDRERLAQYLGQSDVDDDEKGQPRMLPLDVAAYGNLSPNEREAVARRVRTSLARAYLNLGILQAQASRFPRAAELFDVAVELDPAFPQGQYSRGVAYFNAQQYDQAVPALSRAFEQQPSAETARMLALASFQVDDYARAADLLSRDPKLPADPALQYAYGVALVRSDRAEEAERIFSRVLAQNPDVPELNVVLGQAHAARGDFDAAIASFRRALAIKPDVTDANSALGTIYLRQGNLEAAGEALRAELASHPDDVRARNTLATVLDLDGKRGEALKELRTVLARRPDYADARYLLGKILLAEGAAAEAVDHLERAAQLAPADPNVHYQLGQAYQRLGKSDLAAKEFEVFQQLKAKSRGDMP
ncbi:MAG: tetratricopeptide repeat protein [Vicinamibacterales bacterium]